MRIETKYDIGSEVWFIDEDTRKARQATILEVRATICKTLNGRELRSTQYTVGAWDIQVWTLKEEDCYQTKNHLINSL